MTHHDEHTTPFEIELPQYNDADTDNFVDCYPSFPAKVISETCHNLQEYMKTPENGFPDPLVAQLPYWFEPARVKQWFRDNLTRIKPHDENPFRHLYETTTEDEDPKLRIEKLLNVRSETRNDGRDDQTKVMWMCIECCRIGMLREEFALCAIDHFNDFVAAPSCALRSSGAGNNNNNYQAYNYYWNSFFLRGDSHDGPRFSFFYPLFNKDHLDTAEREYHWRPMAWLLDAIAQSFCYRYCFIPINHNATNFKKEQNEFLGINQRIKFMAEEAGIFGTAQPNLDYFRLAYRRFYSNFNNNKKDFLMENDGVICTLDNMPLVPEDFVEKTLMEPHVFREDPFDGNNNQNFILAGRNRHILGPRFNYFVFHLIDRLYRPGAKEVKHLEFDSRDKKKGSFFDGRLIAARQEFFTQEQLRICIKPSNSAGTRRQREEEEEEEEEDDDHHHHHDEEWRNWSN